VTRTTSETRGHQLQVRSLSAAHRHCRSLGGAGTQSTSWSRRAQISCGAARMILRKWLRSASTGSSRADGEDRPRSRGTVPEQRHMRKCRWGSCCAAWQGETRDVGEANVGAALGEVLHDLADQVLRVDLADGRAGLGGIFEVVRMTPPPDSASPTPVDALSGAGERSVQDMGDHVGRGTRPIHLGSVAPSQAGHRARQWPAWSEQRSPR
jgi:hypothetical protein